MSSQPKTYLTPEEYLAIERAAETKSEYFDGGMFMVTGLNRWHNLIVSNLTCEIGRQLKGKQCEMYTGRMRVKTATGLYAYPDVVVVCGEPEFEDEEFDTLVNPTLIAEVLTNSTASYDRGEKFMHYRSISSLTEYLLVAQDESIVEQFVKQPDGHWLFMDIQGLENTANLDAINCTLVLKEVYDRVL